MEYETLDELFEAWKKAHIYEEDVSCEKTFPKNAEGKIPDIKTYKQSFCKDGFLSHKFNGVLFVLKESDTNGVAETNDVFWFKDSLDKEINGETINDSCWKKYRRNMEWYLENGVGKNFDFRECAYMNLNKRGGYGKCDDKQLSNYVNNYRDYIENQIKIIKPKYIFCCGVDGVAVYDLILPIIQNCFSDVMVYKCRHLCFWGNRYIYNK